MIDRLSVEYEEMVSQGRLLKYEIQCLFDSTVFWVWLVSIPYIYIIFLIGLGDFVNRRSISFFFLGLCCFFVVRFCVLTIKSLRENNVEELRARQIIDEDGFKVQLQYSYFQFSWESFGFVLEDEKAFKLLQSFICQNFIVSKEYLLESEIIVVREILKKAPIKKKKLGEN